MPFVYKVIIIKRSPTPEDLVNRPQAKFIYTLMLESVLSF